MGDHMGTAFGFGTMLFWLLVIGLVVLLIVRLSKGNSSAVSNQQVEELAQIQKESLRRQEELAEELKEMKNLLYELEDRLKK